MWSEKCEIPNATMSARRRAMWGRGIIGELGGAESFPFWSAVAGHRFGTMRKRRQAAALQISISYFFHGEPPEEAGGAEEEDDDEDGEGDGVLVGRPLAAVDEGFNRAEDEPAERG